MPGFLGPRVIKGDMNRYADYRLNRRDGEDEIAWKTRLLELRKFFVREPNVWKLGEQADIPGDEPVYQNDNDRRHARAEFLGTDEGERYFDFIDQDQHDVIRGMWIKAIDLVLTDGESRPLCIYWIVARELSRFESYVCSSDYQITVMLMTPRPVLENVENPDNALGRDEEIWVIADKVRMGEIVQQIQDKGLTPNPRRTVIGNVEELQLKSYAVGSS